MPRQPVIVRVRVVGERRVDGARDAVLGDVWQRVSAIVVAIDLLLLRQLDERVARNLPRALGGGDPGEVGARRAAALGGGRRHRAARSPIDARRARASPWRRVPPTEAPRRRRRGRARRRCSRRRRPRSGERAPRARRGWPRRGAARREWRRRGGSRRRRRGGVEGEAERYPSRRSSPRRRAEQLHASVGGSARGVESGVVEEDTQPACPPCQWLYDYDVGHLPHFGGPPGLPAPAAVSVLAAREADAPLEARGVSLRTRGGTRGGERRGGTRRRHAQEVGGTRRRCCPAARGHAARGAQVRASSSERPTSVTSPAAAARRRPPSCSRETIRAT